MKKAIFAVVSGVVLAFVALVILQQVLMVGFWLLASRMDSGWSGEHQEPGPVPLSPPNVSVVRRVNKRTTFETSLRDLKWDEGKGPIDARDRIKPLLDAVPEKLATRLEQTIRIPSRLPGDTRLEDYPTCEAWGVVVSLDPDVLIISAHELPKGIDVHPVVDWDISQMSRTRWQYIHDRDDQITSFLSISTVYAGTLVPWTPEMYVVSTDPHIPNGPLQFNNDRAEITFPTGKLVLVRHGNDVDVSREPAIQQLPATRNAK